MADDEPYDLLPHHEIDELKRQVQELKTKSDKSSSQAIVNSLDQVAKAMDSMLRLFTEAAHEVKGDDQEHDKIMKKLDEIIEQNKTIADGMLSVLDAVGDFVEKQKYKPGPMPGPMPRSRPMPRPNYAPLGPEPGFEPQFDDMPPPPGFRPGFNDMPQAQQAPKGPVPIPSMPFSDFNLGEQPKKKGIFGRLKK